MAERLQGGCNGWRAPTTRPYERAHSGEDATAYMCDSFSKMNPFFLEGAHIYTLSDGYRMAGKMQGGPSCVASER